ncbi:transposase [Deinococcus malanensis]|uniref:Transposase n=2 Tax=Deinococcus malanensis TaxID=1706855 RepID=A0ABQ2F2E1_9DEIO|nr:transposase [Deinococcus malanensis]
MKYPFIHVMRQQFPLRVLCRVLGVTESGYHSWRIRPHTRADNDQELLEKVHEAHQASQGRYGAPRIHVELRAQGVVCSRRRVGRVMRQAGLRGKGKRKYKSTTNSDHAFPLAENLLERNFVVKAPNTVYASDMTYVPTREGWLYLAVVMDLYSRRVVGWAMGSRLTTDLPLSALRMAYQTRRPEPGVIQHSDRGSQYASRRYQQALRSMGMTCSMSRKGDCYDNAVVESFFSSLKREETDGAGYVTRMEAQQRIFVFLEVWYNRKRRHSTLGYLSPAEFEAHHLARQPAAA